MTYFFDNNISPALVQILSLLGVHAVALRDVFPPNVPDHVYISQLHARNWVLVTCDRRIRTRPPEAAALRAAGLTVVFLGSFFLKLDLWGQAAWLVKNWQGIDLFVNGHHPGTISLVKQRGRIEVS